MLLARQLLVTLFWGYRDGGVVTSSASSSFLVNSATTRLICSRCGTYAIPRLSKTFLCDTSSGTRSQSTLNHSWSSPFLMPLAACKFSLSSLFSSSLTSSHSRFRLLTNSCLSLKSSSLNRSVNSIVSSLENRRRKSSVEEKARRRMKCE